MFLSINLRKNKFLWIAIITIPIIIISILLFFFKNMTSSVFAETYKKPCYMAIVIDDFGNHSPEEEEFISLEIPFTGAVLPKGPKTFERTMELSQNNKDVILHMPMEAKNGKASWLGESYLSSAQSKEEINSTLKDCISQFYAVQGINNHMGSLAMESEKIAEELVSFAKENNLYLLDSKTTSKSHLKRIGTENGIRVLERDIFLDGKGEPYETVKKNMKKAGEIAKEKGYAIAIGHVGKAGGYNTLKAIKDSIDQLNEDGIEFVTISQLIELSE